MLTAISAPHAMDRGSGLPQRPGTSQETNSSGLVRFNSFTGNHVLGSGPHWLSTTAALARLPERKDGVLLGEEARERMAGGVRGAGTMGHFLWPQGPISGWPWCHCGSGMGSVYRLPAQLTHKPKH